MRKVQRHRKYSQSRNIQLKKNVLTTPVESFDNKSIQNLLNQKIFSRNFLNTLKSGSMKVMTNVLFVGKQKTVKKAFKKFTVV